MMRCCWICLRRLPVRAMEFVQMEDDGCGEWECLDRRACFFAFLDRDERALPLAASKSGRSATDLEPGLKEPVMSHER